MASARIISPSRPTPAQAIRRAPAISSSAAACAPGATPPTAARISEAAAPALSPMLAISPPPAPWP